MPETTSERVRIPCVEYQPVLFVGEPEGKPDDGVWISGYALVRGIAITPAGEPVFVAHHHDKGALSRLWSRMTAWVFRWTFARKTH